MAYKLKVPFNVLKFNLLYNLACDFYRLISFPKRGIEVNVGDVGIWWGLGQNVPVSIPLVVFHGSPLKGVGRPGPRTLTIRHGRSVFSGHPHHRARLEISCHRHAEILYQISDI